VDRSRFGPPRWIAALILLVFGFLLLAFALLMDARLKPSPYPNRIVVEHGNE